VKPRVSILCHTLAGNALGRAWVFAELLGGDLDVELVASARATDEVWRPLRERGFTTRRWFIRTLPGFHLRAPRIARELVLGDLIIAIKPRLHSFGLALAARRERKRPVLLDIDDWELGFFSPWADAALAPISWVSAASNLHTRWYFQQTWRADAISVTSRFLERRFGGTWIPHARSERLQPLGTQAGHPLVMFVGTPRPHKGLQDLIRAFAGVRTPGAELRIIGAHAADGLASSDPRVRFLPSISMDELPARLSEAWLIVIPQRDEAPSQAQLPAKLIDAMALGKAIVSTDVGDIPRWLSGECGVIVPPADPGQLGAAIDALLADRERRERLGANARARFMELGSIASVRPRLLGLVETLLSGANRSGNDD
jgi:glycosyltransferase involved in cell wall biosynthesis